MNENMVILFDTAKIVCVVDLFMTFILFFFILANDLQAGGNVCDDIIYFNISETR